MPTTRSQTAADDKMTRFFEDSPASPSAHTSHTPANAHTSQTPANAHTSQTPANAHTTTDRPLQTTTNEPDVQTEVGPPRTALNSKAAGGSEMFATRRAPSVHSQRSTASAVARIRQAELEAEERLAEIRRQELQLQATLIKKRLAVDVATIREETDRESCVEEVTDTEHRINNWLHHSQVRGESHEPGDTETSTRYHSQPITRERETERYLATARGRETELYAATMREKGTERCQPITPNNRVTFEDARRPRSPTPTRSRDRGIDRLADALERMARGRAPPRQTLDLPIFSGNPEEWLPFKAAMTESTSIYKLSPAENLARLRTCLRGEAKQAVSALLFTATEPAIIMKTLEQCYGRPEVIIDRALEDIKKLPRLGGAAAELNSFAIKLQNIVTVISCLDERGFLHNPMLTRQVVEKIGPHMRSRWCDYAEEYGSRSEPEIVTVSQFLMREADRAMRHTYTAAATTSIGTTRNPNYRNTEQQPIRTTTNRNRGAKVYATTETNEKKNVCFCCGAEHDTQKCNKLAAMSVSERWEWAKEARVCFRCMNNKHRRFNCKAKKCGVNECRQAHHPMLHSTKERRIENEPTEDSAITASTHLPTKESQVLLKVCQVKVKGYDGREMEIGALLDEGSTISLIDEETAKLIGANGPVKALHIHGATCSQREPESRLVEIKVQGRGQSTPTAIRARTVKNLTLGSQTIKAELLAQPHLRTLKPDDVCYTNARPRMLIGADNWHLIVTRKLLSGRKNQPAASLTQLGWVIHGSAPRSIVTQEEGEGHVLHVRTVQEYNRDSLSTERDNELHELVKSHFDIDALGVSMEKKPVAKDERAKQIFESTVKKRDGRFEVGLPWSSDDVTLPPSYDMAVRRLYGIERKMDKSPEFKKAYTNEINKLLEKGYARQCVEDHREDPKLWYLPHFAVTNPNKPGKIRLVFDAAARANGVCLNDALLDGPDLLQALHGVLFRFRENPVALTADIREMFLRTNIRAEDRVAQHFLWRGDERSKAPRKYEMKSMIFGARSSPFLAHSVRDRNATEHKESHPLAYDAITRNHYVDDFVDSYSTYRLAEEAMKQVQEVHSKAGYELAGWSSNRPELLSGIPEENRASAPRELGANANPYGKTLGILWMSGTDELAFNTAMPRVPDEVKTGNRIPTKREALGMVMSLYDPLGLLSPYTITAKIMLQQLWKKKIGWDDPLPEEEADIFFEWQADLKTIVDLRLPRCYEREGEVRQRQLHVFNDASESGIATVAYWRFIKKSGEISVVLVAGKAKVAPLKAQSIPRLELQACLLGARLAAAIMKEHRWDAEVIYWSDSKTALHWIRNDSSRYTPYVTHRLSEIAELTRVEQWRWTDTKNNPADYATRAGNTRLTRDETWFSGPDFLRDTENHWPKENEPEHITREIVAHVQEYAPLIDVNRFSSYERVVRALATALVFTEKLRRRSTTLSLKHLQAAERLLVIQSQRESFTSDLARLERGTTVDRTSRLYKLDPQYVDGAIRLNGRINAANVPEHMKNPLILDGKHPLTRLIITSEHEKNHHVGREQLVNNLRQRYWILQLRPTVRKILQGCTQCRIRRGKPAVPVKGNLPKVRLENSTRPFSRCGVDCFGPMWVTIGRRKEKRWGMLFTCLVTRAIHIELIPSLSTDSAIMALRRMSARRGQVETIWSDNATNFKSSSTELDHAYKEWLPEMQKYALTKRIEWRFIDPGAPNQGGAWERQISTVKRAIALTLNERAPKDETLQTLMTEIEHTVNSRPLTHVPVSPEDTEALTPNHFLLGTSVGLPYVGECSIADKRTWRATQALANTFWARWLSEYLPTLTPRGEARNNAGNVAPGNIVIIADGLLPRNMWPRGKVEHVYQGPDGVVRSADVRTRGGVFRRPVRRLIVLPIKEGFVNLRRGEAVADEDAST